MNTSGKKSEADITSLGALEGKKAGNQHTFGRVSSQSSQKHQQAAMSLNWTMPHSNLHKIVIQDEQK